MTPLERAARAAMRHLTDEGGMPFEVGDAIPPVAYEVALAVIEAIREPSETMTLRVDEAANGHGDYIFRTMIDALLQEH